VIIRLPDELSESSDHIAQALLDSNPNISKVALDLGVGGQYRLRKLELIGGEPGFVSVHKENGLTFKLDISKVYFSPRLAMERQRISKLVDSGEKILDAFAGAAPFSVTLARRGCRVTAVDANPESEKWAHDNFHLNHIPVSDYDFICSRIEDTVADLDKYDRIIMNNPTKSLSYVDLLSPLVRPGGYIHLYCMAPKDGSLDVMENFGSEFECTRTREVHPYSPSTSLMVFDIKKVISNVQSGNQ
jgi:tRNA (guanine37-N1)-methyltransferase